MEKYTEGRIKLKQLKWFGYVLQMEEDWKPRQIMKARLEARRTKGRPRKICMNDIEVTRKQNGTGMTELRKIAGDRRGVSMQY